MSWNIFGRGSYRSLLKSQVVGGSRLLVKRNKPICAVSTNLANDRVPKDFLQGMTKVIADILNKPQNMITVKLQTDVKLWRGVEEGPTATVDIWSIGVFDPVRNEKYTPLFYQFLSKHLDIPEERITLLYHPIDLDNVGHLTQIRLRNEGKL